MEIIFNDPVIHMRPTEGYVPTYPEKPQLKMSGLLKALVSKVQ